MTLQLKPHRKRKWVPLKVPALNTASHPLTLLEELGGTPENPAPSKFGGTTLERAVDNAAARLGFEFDAAQVTVPLLSTGYYTVIDRVMYSPLKAVYVDGPQHDLRLDRAQTDLLQDNELRDNGWMVIRLKYLDLTRDPIGTVRQVLYGVG